jgi:hypothetical protein
MAAKRSNLAPRKLPAPETEVERRGLVKRANGDWLRRLTIYVAPELGRTIEALRQKKQHDTGKVVELSEVVSTLLEAGLRAGR